MTDKNEVSIDTIVSLCKQRGFIFPGSEIYGGLANSWDYGPLGAELRKNIKEAWWRRFVQARPDMVGLDAAIIMNNKVWEASGHIGGFNDPLVDCRACKTRFRADHLSEEHGENDYTTFDFEALECPSCGKKELTKPRQFNMMFRTFIGAMEETANQVYLRPETAAGIFMNYKNIVQSSRMKVPFGIGQIGKAFRNEITPGNFTFRTLEFEQMEIEYFIREEQWEEMFELWREEMLAFAAEVGIATDKVHELEVAKEDLAHYSKRTLDFEFDYPFGRKELWGLAYRTDHDLKAHQELSGEDLEFNDQAAGEKFIPHVVEPTFGVDRTLLAILVSAYTEEEVPSQKEGGTDTRVVMKFTKEMAPYKVAVLPLSKKPELTNVSRAVYDQLAPYWHTDYDVTQSIGKRYRRQDEIGTPYCVTVDFDSIDDGAVTVRDRDSMEQERIKIDELNNYLLEKL